MGIPTARDELILLLSMLQEEADKINSILDSIGILLEQTRQSKDNVKLP